MDVLQITQIQQAILNWWSLLVLDDDVAGNEADSIVSTPIEGKNPQPAFYGLVIYHMAPIFYCLISYVYYLIALGATQWASFLRHLTSFAYCLLPFVLKSIVYCLPSELFCHI